MAFVRRMTILGMGVLLLSSTLMVGSATAATQFFDGFELGSLAAPWANNGVVTQQADAYDGQWLARATSTGTAVWANATIGPTLSDGYAAAFVKIVSNSTNVWLLRLRAATGSPGTLIASVGINKTGNILARNETTNTNTASATTISAGTWHQVELHAQVNGATSMLEVWLDGNRIGDVSGTTDLGTTPVGRIQIGDNTGSRTFDVKYDDVAVDPSFIGDSTPPSVPTGLAATTVAWNHVALSWNASPEADTAGYTIYRDGAQVGTTSGQNQTTFDDATVAANTSYGYAVDAVDTSGNHSPASSPALSVMTPAQDSTPPSAPTGLATTLVSSNHVALSWNASPEADTAGYTIYRDGAQVGTASGQNQTTFDDATVAANTSYGYAVDAVDTSGNHSPASSPALSVMTAPAPPTGLSATSVTSSKVSLAWNASSGAVGYTIFRGGTQVGTTSGQNQTTFDDTGVSPSTSYSYAVDAVDASGDHSQPSSAINVKTPTGQSGPLLDEGFESGNVNLWTDVVQVVAQQQEVRSGAWAARATAPGTPAWAMAPLSSAQNDVYAEVSFKIIAQSSNAMLTRFRSQSSGLIAAVGVNAKDKLLLRNDVVNQTLTSTRVVSTGVWHEVQLHALVNGTSSQLEVWLDGDRVNDVSGAASLGPTPIARLQIGDNTASRTYDIAYDDVVADTAFIAPPSTPTGLTATTVASDHVDLAWTGSPEPDVAGYTIYRDGVFLQTISGAGTTTYTDSAVVANTTYVYTIDSFDTSSPPLHSQRSPDLTVTTPGTTTSDPVVAAAGDVACDPANASFNGGNGTATQCRAKYTAAVLSSLVPNLQGILVMGDTQYECGGPSAYQQSYGPSWGQPSLYALSHPTPGEQEYLTSGGTDCQSTPGGGYFGYFGSKAVNGQGKSYYSLNIGAWHVISLNSNCSQASVGGCASNSPQYQWLQSDLNANPSACTMVMWHTPAYSPSSAGGTTKMRPIFTLLYNANAEIVLNGNQHLYDRYAELNGSGSAVTAGHGLREFIVGTGGRSLGKFGGAKSADEQVRFNDSFGVLKVTLHPTSYDWQFIDAQGSTSTDSGSTMCH